MEKENIREKEEMFIKFTDKALINMLLYNNNILHNMRYYVNKVSSNKYTDKSIMNTLANKLLEYLDDVDANNIYNTKHIITNKIRGKIDILKSYKTGSISRGLVHCDVDILGKDLSYLEVVKTALEILEINLEKEKRRKIRKRLAELSNINSIGKFTASELKERLQQADNISLELVMFICWVIINLAEPDEQTGNIKYSSIDNYKLISSVFESFVRNVFINELDKNTWVSLETSSDRTIHNGNKDVTCDIVLGHRENGVIDKIYLVDAKAYISIEQNSNLNSVGGEMCKYYCAWLGYMRNKSGIGGVVFKDTKIIKNTDWEENIKCLVVYPKLAENAREFDLVYMSPKLYESRIDISENLDSMKNEILTVLERV